jgi:hypothetical protein
VITATMSPTSTVAIVVRTIDTSQCIDPADEYHCMSDDDRRKVFEVDPGSDGLNPSVNGAYVTDRYSPPRTRSPR